MDNSKPNALELAKQGNPQAIAALLNSKLKNTGVSVRAYRADKCLRIIFEGHPTPEKLKIVPSLEKSLKILDSKLTHTVLVYGRETGNDLPDWQEEVSLTSLDKDELDLSGGAIQSVDQEEGLLAKSPIKRGFSIGNIGGFISAASQNAGNAASTFSKTAFQSATKAGEVIGDSTSKITLSVSQKVTETGKFVGNSSSQAVSGLGDLVDSVNNNPLFQQATKALQIDWLVTLLDRVDLVKAEEAVKTLQNQYPEDSSRQIAHRLMVSKLTLAASSGFVTSLVPGAAAPMMLVDLTATMGLQAEMVFQIAAAYGLDLHESARKGEVIAIFGLSAGGNQVLKLGSGYAAKAGFLGFLRNIPVAGAAIGASSNAALTYALGYAACRFYESKISPLSSEKALEASQEESQNYLKEALSQQVLMDQVLVHVINAGNPKKSWKDILPELKSINISPNSLEIIEQHLDSPPSLESLLENINQDFAVPLFLQCKKIAKLDNLITPEESMILELITTKLNLSLSEILSD
jgi:uncharacterized protein (DUF697 family)